MSADGDRGLNPNDTIRDVQRAPVPQSIAIRKRCPIARLHVGRRQYVKHLRQRRLRTIKTQFQGGRVASGHKLRAIGRIRIALRILAKWTSVDITGRCDSQKHCVPRMTIKHAVKRDSAIFPVCVKARNWQVPHGQEQQPAERSSISSKLSAHESEYVFLCDDCPDFFTTLRPGRMKKRRSILIDRTEFRV